MIAVLVITMAGFSTAALGAQPLILPAISPTTSPSPSPSANTRLIASNSSNDYSIPSTCSVPIIPAIVTPEEVELRQYQVDFAKFIEQETDLLNQNGLLTKREAMSIERFRLDCEIMLLRAQQILTAQDATDAEDRVAPLFDIIVTPEEVEIRKRQFDIAKYIDNNEIIAQENGVSSRDQLWRARRNRIDADILLTQATVQQNMQNRMLNRQRLTE